MLCRNVVSSILLHVAALRRNITNDYKEIIKYISNNKNNNNKEFFFYSYFSFINIF